MSLPPTSVVIASRDRPELLADTVASVLKGDEVPAEIVIVDQSRQLHPTLGNLVSVQGCEILYTYSPTVGLSRGRNLGITTTKNDLLVIIDDDVYVDGSWLSNIVKALDLGGGQTVISGQVKPYYGNNVGGFVPSTITSERPVSYRGRIDADVLYTNNMAIHRTAFDAVGLFDERLGAGSGFPGAEDCDLGFRLLEAGFEIHYEPEAVVYHRAWRQEVDFLPLRWNYGLGRGAFYAKHIHFKDRYMLRRMLTDIRNHVLAFPGRFRHQPLEARGDLVLSWGILVGAFRWMVASRNKKTVREP